MRRYWLQLSLCLALSVSGWATCGTVVQHKVNASCAGGGTTCAVTVTSTGTGHVLVAAFSLFNQTGTVTLQSVSAGGTFTHCSNCVTKDTGNDEADISYTANSTSGVTSITITLSAAATNSWTAGVTEFSCTGTPAFDVSGSNADTTCTTCAGHALTLAGSSDAIFQVVSCGQTCSAVTSPYSTNADFPGGNGMASAAGQSSGTAPNWTQAPTGVASGASIAFNDAVACTPTLTLLGVGRCG